MLFHFKCIIYVNILTYSRTHLSHSLPKRIDDIVIVVCECFQSQDAPFEMQSSSFACSYNSQARLLDLDYLSRCFRPMKTTSLVAAPFLITSLLSQPFPIQQLLHGIATEHLEWCQVAMVSAFLFVFLCLSCGSKTLLRYFIWLPFTFAFTQTQVFLFLFMSLQPSCRIISSHSFFCACTSGPQRARAHLH